MLPAGIAASNARLQNLQKAPLADLWPSRRQITSAIYQIVLSEWKQRQRQALQQKKKKKKKKLFQYHG